MGCPSLVVRTPGNSVGVAISRGVTCVFASIFLGYAISKRYKKICGISGLRPLPFRAAVHPCAAVGFTSAPTAVHSAGT